jgi:hypothetical protein
VHVHIHLLLTASADRERPARARERVVRRCLMSRSDMTGACRKDESFVMLAGGPE